MRKMNAVFIAKRKISEQILKRVDPALCQQFGALGADALDHSYIGCEAHCHRLD
jgi:hypothetical protein